MVTHARMRAIRARNVAMKGIATKLGTIYKPMATPLKINENIKARKPQNTKRTA